MVSRAKGFFKEEGANVTGILTSAGGGTTLRNMLAGGVPYGEVNPGVLVGAMDVEGQFGGLRSTYATASSPAMRPNTSARVTETALGAVP